MIPIPVVETERLILRGWREGDLDAWAEILSDEETTHFIGGVQSRMDAWRGIASIIGHWALRGFGFWAVERKEDREFLGRVGLWRPEGWPGTELAVTLGRPYWGQGYATEATKASADYGFRNLSVPKLISLIDSENHASQRVAERLGAIQNGKTTITMFGRSYVLDLWEISRERWRLCRAPPA